jgi:MYXO-CTERM domain-containing protein
LTDGEHVARLRSQAAVLFQDVLVDALAANGLRWCDDTVEKESEEETMKRTILTAMTVVMITSPAWAIRDFTPPWGWSGPSITTQGWESTVSLTSPSFVDNAYGMPQILWDPFTQPGFDPNGPGYTGIPVWHVGVDGGGFTLYLPNDPTPRPQKRIHLQYTSNKASMGAPVTSPGGTAQAGGVAGHPNAWYTYEWTITIHPNPSFETVFVPFYANTNIEEIWASTICEVPEPGALALLALGGATVIRRRRAIP